MIRADFCSTTALIMSVAIEWSVMFRPAATHAQTLPMICDTVTRMPCVHMGYHTPSAKWKGVCGFRKQPSRSLKPLLLAGSQRAGSPSFVLHAAAQESQQPRGSPSSRPRPPLQRQRPGPQRPMDARQRQQEQRPQRQTPPFKHEPDAQLRAQKSNGPLPQAQQPNSPQRGLQQRKPEEKIAPLGGPPKQMTAAHFCLQFDTQYGQRIRLVGSHHNLGQSPPQHLC